MIEIRNKIKVLLTKARVDGHDRGVRTVASGLMKAGMEVIFTRYRVPEEIVATAIQEDVDVIGVSFSTGGHTQAMSKLMRLLKEKKMENILVIIGGTIPSDDIATLQEMGVARVFGPGASIVQVTEFITSRAIPRG